VIQPGLAASRILPTICIHIAGWWRVSPHLERQTEPWLTQRIDNGRQSPPISDGQVEGVGSKPV
jgi:hypothetical protein